VQACKWAWTFAQFDPERLEAEARQRPARHRRKAGFGPMLSWDPEEGLALIKPRPPGNTRLTCKEDALACG